MKIKTIIMILVASILIYSSYDVNAEETLLTGLTNNANVSQSANRDDTSISYIPVDGEVGYKPLDTRYVPTSGYYINRFHVRSYNSTVKKFITDFSYNVTYTVSTNPSSGFYECGLQDNCNGNPDKLLPMISIFNDINILGAPEPNYNNISEEYVKNVSCSIGSKVDNYQWTINCVFTPNRDLHGIYTAFFTNTTYTPMVGISVNYKWALTAFRIINVEITENSGLQGSINNQTQIIINGNNEINNNLEGIKDTITGDYEYDDTPLEEIQGKEEMDEMKELEEGILGNLDLSATDTLDITINPNASKFIWDIVEELRGINTKIVMLITSILGLGIIKMILNR